MVKIKDLTEKQLLSQIEKYEKIYTQLLAERDKRVAAGANPDALKTVAEKTADKIRIKEMQEAQAQAEASDSTPESSESFHLSIDDNELSAYASEDHSVGGGGEAEEVRVTQLLKLSKEQLNELRSGGANKKKKKG